MQERAAYILMQRIKPQPYEAYVYRKGESSLVQAICELGIFSVYVRYRIRTRITTHLTA
jgi:hypothetical protein